MKTQRKLLIIFFTALLPFFSACVKQPTAKESTVDLRPAISFTSQTGSLNPSYVVYVDRLLMGSVTQYRAGDSALRILSGSHLISVQQDGDIVYEQTIYVGEGAIKEIVVP